MGDILAFAIGAPLACLLAVWAIRARSVIRVAMVAALIAGLSAAVPARVSAASGSVLFAQSFGNNTIDPKYPVALPGLPGNVSGSNAACLTASGNTSSGVLRSCPSNNDSNGSGNLRLTAATGNQEGGVFAATSVPTSEGIDATFTTYQYGGTLFTPADGIGFTLAAVNPANPVSPATIGQPGGGLGYSANAGSGQAGVANAYMGIGLDVYGNFSNSSYQGTGCSNPSYIATGSGKVPGQVVVRGPGNRTVGYCALSSTASSTTAKALTLHGSSRSQSVPVEVVINPTSAAFTTASGILVGSGTYKVVFTPIGGSPTTVTGPLPVVPAGLYPSSSWTTSAGIPRQLAFGWTGSTGGNTDFHEVDQANVVSFTPVPQLTMSLTAYSAATPAPGAPVTYTASAGVSSSGPSEDSPIAMSETLPAGVTPVGAYGTGWNCAAPTGQVITCTDSNAPFAAGSTLPPITVEGIVTTSGVTSGTVQSSTTATASSADGNPAFASSAAAGTLPAAPSGVSLSPASGSISGGNAVTVSGSNISGATAIEIGTTSQQQAGTPVVLLPCPSGPAPGCFTVNGNGTLSISSMPSVPAVTTVNVTVVTLGIAGAAPYTYTATPGTPAAPTATAGITSATVSWTAPASNNSPITGYTVTPYLAGVAQTPQSYDASTTTRTITGLTAGASYTFTVAAVNAVGTGAASPQSNAVTPYALPGAPVMGAVSPGNSAATVSWTAPASNGSPITGYVVTPYIAGVAQAPQTFNSTATTQTVTGLTPGTSYTFRVAAINAAGTGPPSAMSAAVTVNAAPFLTFGPPPAGEVSIPYSVALTATGGTGALTWSVNAGSLPPGLTLNSSTGQLSGTPTKSGSYSFSVTVTDTTGGTDTKAVTLVIAAVPSLANPAPPAGQSGVAYSNTLAVTGGTGPFTWAVSSGTLPPGLSLNASTGVLSGTPTSVGLYSFTVKVTDSFGLTATQNLSLSVAVGPLVISATANNSTVAQGATLHYTMTISNTATSTYSGVAFSVPLANVLDDATYNGDAAATSGTVSFASPNLTWTGNLAASATATITFSVTVNNPFTGNGTLGLTVTSATTGTNCFTGSTDLRCTVSVPVSALTIAQTTTVSAAAPGTVVGYTVTVTNSGLVAYSGAAFTDPLIGVLDDAVWGGNAAASSGTVSYTSPNLTWTGDLAAGATATITFSVTVSNPDTGNKVLSAVITSSTAGSNCATGSIDTRCAATVNVAVLTISSTANTASTTPGTTVQYTITVTNSGTASYTGATITDALSGLLDDATYGSASATSGSLSFKSPNLTWTGNLAAGATATITFSATVNNPDSGDKVLATTITSPTSGSNCPSGGTDPACGTSVTVLVPALTIVMTSGVSTTTPGSTVGYTVTVTNSGQTPYTGASVAIAMGGTLDDATYNGNAAASAGSVSFTSPVLTWTGDLALGASATITYSVTVINPDTGNRAMTTAITSAAAGNNCPSGGTDPRCASTVQVLLPGLTLTVSANSASTTAGSTVQYTVVANNTGQTTDSGVSFADSLAGVLDDAAYNGDAAATAGTVLFTSPNLTWTGTLAPGAAATVTFSVTVHNPDTGDKILASAVTSAAVGNNCPSGNTDPRCASTVTVSQLALTNTADVGTTTPGGVVRFTTTFTNTGQTPYTGITISTNASDVFDDAVPNGDQTATSGTTAITGTGVSWTGDIPVGGTVTITGTVTVNNPDTGNKLMTSTLTTTAPGSNCPTGGTGPACTATVTVLIPGLSISNAANTSTPVPGSVVGYTLTITNSGQTAYAGATVTDSLGPVLDDAAYNNDATATAGTVSYTAGVLTWTGDLAVAATATVTFSITVNTPDTGDKVLIVAAASPAQGATCPPGTTTAPCRSTIGVLTPALAIAATTDAASTVPGGTVHYTVTITDTGQTPQSAITVTDSLAGLLDDATYNGDAAATTGTVLFTSPDLAWTGSLNPGDTATITFTATVSNPDAGNHILATAITSAAAGNNCPTGGTDPHCASTVTVSELIISTGADVTTTTPGSVVRFSSTFTNTGQTPYTGITIATNASDIFDDAVANGDQTASSGTLVLSGNGLTWTGDIPVGGTVSVTGTVTVSNPDTGNKLMTAALTSTVPGNNCPTGSADPRCTATVDVLIPGLTISNAVNNNTPVPGSVVGYTLTITNTGQTAYTGITVTDTAATLQNATFNNDAVATAGGVSYAGGVLTWTGDLAVGATATVTFSVTVNNPVTGNKLLIVTAASTAQGSSCPPGTTTSPCRSTIGVLTPELTIVATATVAASARATLPGNTVNYTVTITDTGQTPYTGATVTDSLAGLLDDAAYNSDAAATTGAVTFTSPDLAWTGSLNPGDTATVTFTATVSNPDTGDKTLATAITSAAAGNNCPTGGTDPRCSTAISVQVAADLTISLSSGGISSTVAGDVVHYTVTVTNALGSPYIGASFADSLAGVLDDAAYNNDAAATTGAVLFTSPDLTWTGDVGANATVSVTFSVTVHNPDTGDKILASAVTSAAVGNNCPTGGTDPRCASTVTVASLDITNIADVSTTTPGGVVRYTATFTNTGQTPYTGITVTTPASDVFDDAVPNGDQTATSGTLTLTATGITWTGSIPVGGTVSVTGTVTVSNPDTGNKVMTSTSVTTAPGSNCPTGSPGPACTATVTVLIPGLSISNAADTSTPVPGSVVVYTLTIANSGQTAYAGATVTDSLGPVLDDAAYNNDATATAGTVSYTAGVLTWTGDLPVAGHRPPSPSR